MGSYNTSLENTKAGLARLEKLKVPIDRPSDYLVEMLKTDEQMRRVKQKLLSQQTNIAKFEERKRRKADQKFGKRVRWRG